MACQTERAFSKRDWRTSADSSNFFLQGAHYWTELLGELPEDLYGVGGPGPGMGLDLLELCASASPAPRPRPHAGHAHGMAEGHAHLPKGHARFSLSDADSSSAHLATPLGFGRRLSAPPTSPSSCQPSRSPSLSSDSGKQCLKPQYTAELDVLCRICGDRASGFHYGVHSCEGCKGFFRRTLKKQLVYKPCQMGSQCKIDAGTRNKCQYCRYQRCLNAGMSQDAVRFGRMPKAEREKLMADKEELSSTCSKRIVELRSLTDLIKAAFRESFAGTLLHPAAGPPSCPPNPPTAPQQQQQQPSSALSGHASPPEPMLVVKEEVCDVAELSSAEFGERGVFALYQEQIVPVLEASVKFAKKLPGFARLSMQDQITLMKRNGFMVVQVGLQSQVDKEYIRLRAPGRETLRLHRLSPLLCQELRALVERPVCLADRLSAMSLTTGEVALFCAVLLTTESPGLREPSVVEEVQADLIEALRLELKHNHPKERMLLPRMLMLLPDLAQIVEEFSYNLRSGLFDKSGDYAGVKPLLREIFDLS